MRFIHAGRIRFTPHIHGFDAPGGNRTDTTNRDQCDLRLDHQLNEKYKRTAIYTWERDLTVTGQTGILQWPNGYNGAGSCWLRVLDGSLI